MKLRRVSLLLWLVFLALLFFFVVNIRVLLSFESLGRDETANLVEDQPSKLTIQPTPAPFFSSCLLVMDENHRLPEWIAYHFYALPLRHLVVLVDAFSQTSPEPILDRWRPFMERIDVWSDATIHYTPPPPNETDRKILTHAHFDRQKTFYKHCALYLRRLNRTWTTFHDTDEILYLDPEIVPDAMQRMIEPGSIQTFLDQVQNDKENHVSALMKLPASYNKPCIMVARTFFGATESTPEVVNKDVPPYLVGSHFETLRYLHRTTHGDFELNQRGKSLLHVSLPTQLEFNNRGIHSVLRGKACQPPNSRNSAIRIRHYLGSWEAHSSRVKDPRAGTFARNYEFYQYRASIGHNRPPDDAVRPWLNGFCRLFHHNQTLIQYLLYGAGQVPELLASAARDGHDQWSISPSDVQEQIQRQGNKEGSFGHWLKQRYRLTTLKNGTLVAKRIEGSDKQ